MFRDRNKSFQQKIKWLPLGVKLLKIEMSPMAFYNILEHSSKDLKKEVAGYLIGKLKKGKLHITDTATTQQKATSTHVTLNDLEMVRIAEKLEYRGLHEHIIGWYHSHPKMGAHFFSHTDVATQTRYQQFFPQAIGLVIDPYKFKLSSKFSEIDCHVYHLEGEKLQNVTLTISSKLKKGLNRIYSHINELPPNVSSFLEKLEEFIETELDGRIIRNYHGNANRMNYQKTSRKMWAHVYTRFHGRFKKNDLVIKGFFRGKCKNVEDEFKSIGLNVAVTKDRHTNYYLVILNLERAIFSQQLSSLLKVLYQNWHGKKELLK